MNAATTSAGADEGAFRASRCPPDDLFGVTYPSLIDGAVRAAMPLEDWDFDEDGLLVAGALGVLVDNVLGYANITRAPGRWGITTAMSLDQFPTACAPGEQLHAEARVVHADGLGALAEGRVLSPTGALVATCSQRTRFVDTMPNSVHDLGSAAAPRPDLLAAAVRTDGADLRVEVQPELQNPLGALHGGVSMYVCGRAATEALRAVGSPLGIVSLNMSYLRLLRGAERVRFRPTVVHRGRTFAIVDVVGSLADGRPAVLGRAAAEPAS